MRSVLLWTAGVGFGFEVAAANQPAPDLEAGRAAYQQQCARCHGASGQGDGRDAARLFPKPRDLSSGVYKIRSTASGTAPTDDDLFQTLTNGLSGSGMPDWRHLDEQTRWQLVYYLKSLSSTFTDSPPEVMDLGHDPGPSARMVGQGRQVYDKLGCASCHGALGRANGFSAAVLTDDWGRPMRPANLTEGWNYRGGSQPRAIVARMLTGISGTPMPSYADAVSTEEAWQLAYYVQSLQQEPRWQMIIRVPQLATPLPETVEDPRWDAVKPVSVRVRSVVDAVGAMAAPQTITTLWLQAAADDAQIRFRLSWHDPSEDRQEAADAAAIVFRPPELAGDAVSLQTWPLRHAPALDFCVWSARHGHVSEVLATGYERVLSGHGATLGPGQAAYADGQWTVMVSRPLAPSQPEGAARLVPGRLTPVAFVVWDGANANQRAVSTWVDLAIPHQPLAQAERQPKSPWVWLASGMALMLAVAFVLKRS